MLKGVMLFSIMAIAYGENFYLSHITVVGGCMGAEDLEIGTGNGPPQSLLSAVFFSIAFKLTVLIQLSRQLGAWDV